MPSKMNLFLNIRFIIIVGFIVLNINPLKSQVSYGSDAAYSLRKIVPTYVGNAIQVRRACDNATVNVGFNSCGGLDTTAMKKFVVASNPLSAIASTAATAFSLRKLTCAYGGNAIMVRRSSDNTTSNIGFTVNGDLDTTALKTFVGANNGFVTTWFDQSGNGRNATQGAAGSQPRIVNAGKIEYQNNMPSIRFLGLVSGLATVAFDVFDAAACFNGVAKVNSNLTYNAIVSKTGAGGSNNIPAPLDFYNNNVIVGDGVSPSFFATSQTFNAAQAMGVWTLQSQLVGNKTAFLNSASILNSAGAATHVDVNRPLNIGARNDAVTGLDGWISEVITFAALPTTTDRAFLEWTQGQYYNIAGISLGTVPVGAANGFVIAWYDQSGNGRNATQPTSGNQPKIINVGKISTQNGLPAIALDGTSTWLIQSTLGVTNPYSLNAVATRTVNGGGSGGYQRLINISSTGDASGYLGVFSGNYATFTGNSIATWNDVAADIPLTSVALNAQAILTMAASTGATGLLPFINGTALNAKVGTMAAATGFLIGAAWSTNNTSQLWPGSISEFHIFPTALSTTRRTLIETNQAANYTLPISNNKYTPLTATSYILYVNGVGRESATDSVAGTRSTVGMGISIGTGAGDFLKDNGDYITYGIDCPVSTTVSISNLPGTVQQRWNNDWYLNKTDVGGNNGTLTIFFDFSDFGIGGLMPGAAANYVLLDRSTAAGTFSIVGTATASVVGDRVLFATDASTITTNHFYTIGTKNALASPLPIELVSFNCNLINTKNVELNWTTATEINTDYFSIERSSDAVNFESIGKINSAGNSLNTLNYTLTDEFALTDVSYYRLKSVDLNGSYKYSEICSVTNYNATSGIIIYPNPTNGSVTIDCNQPNSIKTDAFSFMDITGKAIAVPFTSSNNKIIIDMSSLQPGMYFLEVMVGNKKIVEKITLQK